MRDSPCDFNSSSVCKLLIVNCLIVFWAGAFPFFALLFFTKKQIHLRISFHFSLAAMPISVNKWHIEHTSNV